MAQYLRVRNDGPNVGLVSYHILCKRYVSLLGDFTVLPFRPALFLPLPWQDNRNEIAGFFLAYNLFRISESGSTRHTPLGRIK